MRKLPVYDPADPLPRLYRFVYTNLFWPLASDTGGTVPYCCTAKDYFLVNWATVYGTVVLLITQ